MSENVATCLTSIGRSRRTAPGRHRQQRYLAWRRLVLAGISPRQSRPARRSLCWWCAEIDMFRQRDTHIKCARRSTVDFKSRSPGCIGIRKPALWLENPAQERLKDAGHNTNVGDEGGLPGTSKSAQAALDSLWNRLKRPVCRVKTLPSASIAHRPSSSRTATTSMKANARPGDPKAQAGHSQARCRLSDRQH